MQTRGALTVEGQGQVSRPLWQAVLNAPLTRTVVLLGLDGLIAAGALLLAMVLRFEGYPPNEYLAAMWASLPWLVMIRVGVSFALQLHRWSFRMSGLNEAGRLVLATFIGSGLFAAVCLAFESLHLPRSTFALEFFLSTAAMGAVRFGPRMAMGWYTEQVRARTDGAERTIILGAGSAGDLLLRDIHRSPAHKYQVVGFLDDDPKKIGTSLNGKPVLGTLDQLPEVVKRYHVTKVLIAIPRITPERVRVVLRLCSSLKLSFKIIPASFAYFDQKLTAAMLNDLSPEDLLPRDKVSFDPIEIRRHLQGKRVLVTGAAGSIGSEIARQVAQHSPEQLVLLDMNENELYLLTRALEAQHPGLRVKALIADIREEARIQRIGEQYRPHHVFHAAAHKHVPLMEDAPEEALKNNVLGTLHVAKMADTVGAERFVLISTDKAVRPSSVMGASKRAAELVVRAIAESSRTQFTAVRFGNVLGSAGSVVPLFKQQIQRGGPVTITHPECTRYFMTIPEAVGLVLLAGLGGYGQLCILDMGEPIRIAELASNMITMAGLVPGKDIPIQFTGLRPGEKIAEELMTDEEERTRAVRNRILVAETTPPPPYTFQALAQMRGALERGATDEAMQQLRRLVPTYSPPHLRLALPAPENEARKVA